MKLKNGVLITSVVVVLVVASTFVSLCRYQPALPKQWHQIHRGQPRSEVLQLLPELMTDLYEMRLDQTYHFSESPVFGHVSQYLIIVYGPDDRVTDIQVRTITARFRLLRNQGNVSRNVQPINAANEPEGTRSRPLNRP